MGRKVNVAKASLAAVFLAAGGAVASQARAAANPDAASLDGIVSSYFGPLGLRDDFQHYMKDASGFNNFDKWFKFAPADATRAVDVFSLMNKVKPPPGFEQDGGGDPGL